MAEKTPGGSDAGVGGDGGGLILVMYGAVLGRFDVNSQLIANGGSIGAGGVTTSATALVGK